MPVRELAAVDEPVAERAVVVVALAEPAVVEHEQLDPEVAGDLGDRDEPVLVEVEVGALPVVHEDRPRPVAPRSRGRAARGTGDGTRRSSRRARRSCGRGPPREGQLRARREGPRERLGVDPDPEPRRPERLDLHLGEEVARVDEGDADRLAVVLGRRRAAEGHERVVDGRRGAAIARDRLAAQARAAASATWRSRAQ